MPFWLDDLDNFFQDFSQTVTLQNGVTVRGIISNEQAEINGAITEIITLTLKTFDIADIKLKAGQNINIAEKKYYILEPQPDSDGITTIILTKDNPIR